MMLTGIGVRMLLNIGIKYNCISDHFEKKKKNSTPSIGVFSIGTWSVLACSGLVKSGTIFIEVDKHTYSVLTCQLIL